MTQALEEIIWQGFRWTWDIDDPMLLAEIDAGITKAFRDLNYKPQPREEFLKLIGSSYVNRKDTTHAFFGDNGSCAVCFKCEIEERGLHIHMVINDQKAYEDIDEVERIVSNPALKVYSLKNIIFNLTWGHKLTIFSVIFSLLGSIMTLATEFVLTGILLVIIKSLFAGAVILSIIYLIIILFLMITRAYYALKLVRRF